jgi:sigma-B regulation protein RsbU (phosphoserine phosphatase)
MALPPDQLKLTDFMDLATLQEIQDSFAAVANVKATILDDQGNILTSPTPTKEFLRRQKAIEDAEALQEGPQREGREYVAPIIVASARLGSIRMSADGTIGGLDDTKLTQLSEKFGIDLKQIKSLAQSFTRARKTRPAAIQFLTLLANAIARLCYQEFQLRSRINELTAIYNVAMILADAKDLPSLLQRTVEIACEVGEVKAASIRLLDDEGDELLIKAVNNLSRQYLDKGPLRLSKSIIDSVALSPKGYEYVANMASDPRVIYPEEAAREGIVSMVSVGMRYKGKPIGAMRVYSDHEQTFSPLKISLLKAIAAQAAAAIENARLAAEARDAEALERQVRMAADVQQRMIPQQPPKVPNVELTSVFYPCFELGGDLFDFIPFSDDNVGLLIADVSGKGVPASLTMASVRAALRAQVDNVYNLSEVMRRVNLMLVRDTKPTEFVTLFYGVLDARKRRLTYCNAGHPAGLVLRDGKLIELGGDNLVLGVNPDEVFIQKVFEFKSGDTFLLYTDGVTDVMNFEQQTFGRQRLLEAFMRINTSAETVAQNILWEMRRFAGLTRRTDDVTMIVAKMK